MKRPKTHPKTGRPIVPVGYIRGKAIWPILGASPDDPNDGDQGGDDGSGDGGDKGGSGSGGKTFDQAEVNRIAAKEKAAGRRAAEEALAESLGVSVDEAKKIIAKHKETEDANKSEAEKERAAATKEREAAEAEKRAAAAERHELQIERTLTKEGFSGDSKKLDRVRRMITVEVGASAEDIAADVQEAKKDFPELFASKTGDGDGGKPPRKLPNSDPAGKPPPPKPGEDKFTAGAKRFEERNKRRQGFNPLAKQDA